MSMLSMGSLGDQVALGNFAGYALTFHKRSEGKTVEAVGLMCTSDQYDATIDASLPAGLAGGTYTITVEGMTDADYALIANQKDEPDNLRVVRVHLYWRDANSSVGGYLANAVGLSSLLGGPSAAELEPARVAELCISSVKRKAGARRYEAVIEATEAVFASLQLKTTSPIKGTYAYALKALSQQLGVPMKTHLEHLPAQGRGKRPGKDLTSIPKGTKGEDALHKLGRQLEKATQSYGRGMYLIRKGTLHVGTRPIPLEGKPTTLDLGGGLVEVAELEPVSRDPEAGSKKGGSGAGGVLEVVEVGAAGGGANKTPPDIPKRDQFKITLKGRPDLLPGDVVLFDRPSDDAQTMPGLGAALAGPLAGPITAAMGGSPETRGYVSAVHHRFGRASGFVTELTTVVLDEGDTGWDSHTTTAPVPRSRDGKPTGAAAGPIEGVLDGLEKAFERLMALWASVDVAEVRDHTTDAGDDPTTEPPNQSVTVLHGTTDADGRGAGARRLDIEREDPLELSGLPYATPFAWGSCGLVLPRYPGTRVVTLPRHNDHDDRIDVGAIWPNGTAPASHPGDWWLILPVGAPTTASPDSSPIPTDVVAVTNDLIDGEGDRCIDVGRLRIRVGPSGLPGPGDRPSADETEYVSIEHEDTVTKIVIDKDGAITIHAAKNLTLESDQDIEMKANNVNISVQTAVNVN